MNEAIEKINKEITESNNQVIKKIGEHVITMITGSEGNANKVLVEGKTLKGSLAAMSKHAKTIAIGGSSVLTDEQGYEQVDEYYGFDKDNKRSGVVISLADIL